MKKNLKLLALPLTVFALVGSGILSGCGKQETPLAANAPPMQEGVTAEKDFDRVLEATMKMVDETNHLQISKVKGGYVFALMAGPGK